MVFDRLYVLRNQLVHGGATWNSSVNRAQVRDGAAILGFLLPVFVDLMMDNPRRLGQTLLPGRRLSRRGVSETRRPPSALPPYPSGRE